MAYKSKVSNKYFGSTFAGRVKPVQETQLTQLSKSLQTFSPQLANVGTNYALGKREDAMLEMQKLYQEGKSADEIAQIALSGKNPKLSNMYAESAVESQNGRFAAAEAKADIKRAMSENEYNFQTDNLIDFHNKYLQKYDLNSKSKNYVLGFTAHFGEWQEDQKLTDAENKAAHFNNKKIQKVVTLIENIEDVKDIMPELRATSVELPQLDGSGKKQFFISPQEENTILLSTANKLYNTSDKIADLERAQQILKLDRGTGKGGNKLGSLLDTDPKAQQLDKKIEDRITAMENQSYVDNQRNIQQDKDERIKNIFNEDDLGKRQKLVQDLVDTYPTTATTINNITTNINEIFEDKGGVSNLKNKIVNGEYIDSDYDAVLRLALEETNSWNTIEELINLNQSMQIGRNEGYGNPVNDTEVVELKNTLQRALVDLIPEDAYGDDNQRDQIAFDLVNMDIESEYRQWYVNNIRPSKSAPIKDQEAWLVKQTKWINDKYAEKTSLYQKEEFGAALDKKLIDNFYEIGDLDLDGIPQNWANTQIQDTSEKFRGEELDSMINQANATFTSVLEILQQNPRFRELMESEGFRKIQTDASIVAEDILKRLGVNVTDYSEEIRNLEDSIINNEQTVNLGNFEDIQNRMENNFLDGVDDADVQKLQEDTLVSLERILGMPPSINLIANLNVEAQEKLAAMYGLNEQQFGDLLSFVFDRGAR